MRLTKIYLHPTMLFSCKIAYHQMYTNVLIFYIHLFFFSFFFLLLFSLVTAAAWWQQHGINCLELRRIAIRILSQTCSSFGCAHNYSTLDHCYNTRRNRVAQKRLNDFAFVHYNLRLRERQLKRIADDSRSLDNVPFSDSFLDDWIVEPEKPAQQEDEVFSHSSIHPSIFPE